MKRHPFDPWSFVLGLLFLATGLAFLTGSLDLLHTNAAVLWTIPLLAIGLLIVLTNAHRIRGQQAEAEASAVEPADGADPDRPASSLG